MKPRQRNTLRKGTSCNLCLAAWMNLPIKFAMASTRPTSKPAVKSFVAWSKSSRSKKNLSESRTGFHPALLLAAPSGAIFGNIVTTVYSAILREISEKGKDARFTKTERGKFAANAA